MGYKLATNNDLPVPASNAKSIFFGDFTKYVIRRIRHMELHVFRELYMANLQVGYLAYQRIDGNLINAGGNPLKYLQQSAT